MKLLGSTLTVALVVGQASAFLQPLDVITTGPPPPTPSGTALHAQRQEGSSRAEALRLALGVGGLVLAGRAQGSSAAVPTIDEYYIGSGSVIRPPPGKEGQQAPAPATAAKDPSIMPPPSTIIAEAQGELDRLEGLVTARSWGNVVDELKKPPLSLVRAKFFGRKSLGELAGSLKMPSTARGIEDIREEAAVALTTLLDFSFSNRVIYFNKVDKAAVEALTAASAEALAVDLEEPRAAIKEARVILKKLEVMV